MLDRAIEQKIAPTSIWAPYEGLFGARVPAELPPEMDKASASDTRSAEKESVINSRAISGAPYVFVIDIQNARIQVNMEAPN